MQFNPHIKELQHGLGVPADGKRGPVTTTAILLAADEGRLVVKPKAEVAEKFQAPGYADLVKLYGKAGGPDCTAGRVVLPFAFKLAWDLDQLVKIISCHTLVAEPLTRIWDETARHYGEKQFRELGLDLYGGCFNYRPMRGSDKLSTHAWGIAQDVDPLRNQLRWNHNTAVLARAEYLPFWKIVEANGAYSLGRENDYDWMHFQFCKP